MVYSEKESSILEFKESLPQNNQIIKTLIGFCNHKGGKVIVGIRDDGTIKGLTDEEAEATLEYLNKQISEATSPPIIVKAYLKTLEEKSVLVIAVSSGMNKPYYLKKEGLEKGTYIRVGRSTIRATSDMLKELRWESINRPFELMPIRHAEPNDLDLEKLQLFIKTKKGSKIINTLEKTVMSVNQALIEYNLATEIHAEKYPTIAGILLFGKRPDRYLPEAFIICSRFKGIEGRTALATQDCMGTLFTQFKEAESFVLSHLDCIKIETESGVIQEYDIPSIAVREAIVNALVHRNYHIQSPTKIALYDNRLEIFSPGGLPGPLREDNLFMGMSFLRNNAISRVFRLTGYIEKLGTGIQKIFSSYAIRGSLQPTIIEGGVFVKYILPRLAFIRLLHATEDEDKLLEILNLFHGKIELTMRDIMEKLQIKRTTAKQRLGHLVKMDLLEKLKFGKTIKYRVASEEKL